MKRFVVLFFLFFALYISAQNPDFVTTGTIDTVAGKVVYKNPMKASLYSAILPGLGQVYNEQYWKVPLVWATVGTGMGFIIYYNNRYRFYRDGFIASLNGEETGFPSDFTSEILARAQDLQRRNRDYAIVITSLLYALNILDAIVAAHLSEMKNDKDLVFSPVIIPDFSNQNAVAGMELTFKF